MEDIKLLMGRISELITKNCEMVMMSEERARKTCSILAEMVEHDKHHNERQKWVEEKYVAHIDRLEHKLQISIENNKMLQDFLVKSQERLERVEEKYEHLNQRYERLLERLAESNIHGGGQVVNVK